MPRNPYNVFSKTKLRELLTYSLLGYPTPTQEKILLSLKYHMLKYYTQKDRYDSLTELNEWQEAQKLLKKVLHGKE